MAIYFSNEKELDEFNELSSIIENFSKDNKYYCSENELNELTYEYYTDQSMREDLIRTLEENAKESNSPAYIDTLQQNIQVIKKLTPCNQVQTEMQVEHNFYR